MTVAPLPAPGNRLSTQAWGDPSADRLLAELPDDAVLLVTIGTVNHNRRIDLLLEAIAGDDVLARRLHLWAVGPCDDTNAADLRALAQTLGLSDRFEVTGRVSDTTLAAILSRADIGAALRDPVLEGQSASTLTQLASGLPVVVYDHAHYTELPDDVATKVDPAAGAAGIRAALRLVTDDDEGRVRRGQRGREYVAASRSGAAYAAAILEAGEHATAAIPLMHLSADLGARLRRLGLHELPAVMDVVTDAAFDLFDLA